jgi:phospholipid/cholesterol/gamma-HCH transport system substrate-binding protein
MTAAASTVPPPERPPSTWDKVKYKLYGLILLAIVAVFVGLCVLQFNEAFTPTDRVYVDSGRAGLQMTKGNRVEMRGVQVGKVADVERNAQGGVNIAIDMQPDQMASIPGNPVVALSQLTAFGAKTVQMSDPAQASGTLQDGAHLDTGHVTVEVNDLFQRLQTVLNTADPAKVSTILGGLSSALNGRGEDIGQTVEAASAYLKNLNTDLPQLRRDFAKGATVTNTYADVVPDLLQTLDNLRTPSRTLVEQQRKLDGFLGSLEKFGNTGQSFFAQNGPGLESTAADLKDITGLLKKYSPEFSCWIKGIDEAARREKTQQGQNFPGFEGNTTIEYGRNNYRYPDNRPVVGSNNGPDCNGLPYITAPNVPAGLFKNVDKGGGVADGPDVNTARQPLVATLFGPNATLPFTPTPQAGGNENTIPGGTGK